MIYGSKVYNHILNWKIKGLSFMNHAKGKKKVAKFIYEQLSFKCGLMTLYCKFKSKIF